VAEPVMNQAAGDGERWSIDAAKEVELFILHGPGLIYTRCLGYPYDIVVLMKPYTCTL
jgi:hypothetical protein